MSAPPSYDAAISGNQPAVAVTNPQGQTTSGAAAQRQQTGTGLGGSLGRMRSNDSIASVSSVGSTFVDEIGEDGRRSMDDERRELPEGWVRCFDPKTEHHFYVEEATKRASWVHPYDDPIFLQSLPESHPANPNSEQAKAMRQRADEERKVMEKARTEAKRDSSEQNLSPTSAAKRAAGSGVVSSDESRNWFQKQKDKLIGTKEERQKAKEERHRIQAEERKRAREQQEEYLKRRRELLQKQLNDPNLRQYYASDPYSYAAPTSAYSRSYGSPYGYGYGGGYGRRYGGGYPGYGYGYGLGPFGAGGLGLGGGLLLGSTLGGGGYGGFGGGGFGGGGFDGGGFAGSAGGDMGGGFSGAM